MRGWDSFMQNESFSWDERVRVRRILADSLCSHIDLFRRPDPHMVLDDDKRPEWSLREFLTDYAVAIGRDGRKAFVSYHERFGDPSFSHINTLRLTDAEAVRLGL